MNTAAQRENPASDDCVLCEAAGGAVDEALVLAEDGIVATMDRFPIEPGHLLVFPQRHVADTLDLPLADFQTLMLTIRSLARALALVVKPYKVACFTAGKEVEDHAHVHLLPIPRGLKRTFASLDGLDREVVPLPDREEMADRIRAAYQREG